MEKDCYHYASLRPSNLSFQTFGTLEGTKDQDTNREDGVFAMTSNQQASIFTMGRGEDSFQGGYFGGSFGALTS